MRICRLLLDRWPRRPSRRRYRSHWRHFPGRDRSWLSARREPTAVNSSARKPSRWPSSRPPGRFRSAYAAPRRDDYHVPEMMRLLSILGLLVVSTRSSASMVAAPAMPETDGGAGRCCGVGVCQCGCNATHPGSGSAGEAASTRAGHCSCGDATSGPGNWVMPAQDASPLAVILSVWAMDFASRCVGQSCRNLLSDRPSDTLAILSTIILLI